MQCITRLLLCLLGFISLVDCKNKCEICKEFAASFQKEFDKTAKSNYAGGDTAWEEEKLGAYANSEVRFVEIMEGVCKHSDNDCHSFVSYNEETIEEWWSTARHKNDEIEDWLCTTNIKVCCPKNMFGQDCQPCPGGATTPCSGHGSCEGGGHRDGKGSCSCDKAYTGERCDQCSSGHYNQSDDCLPCHTSCQSDCYAAGPKGCVKCKDGWSHDPQIGCKDVNECSDGTSECEDDEYCQNKPGSFSCVACDYSCSDGCTGPGNGACVACAKGYHRSDDSPVCEDDDECSTNSSLCTGGTYCDNIPGSYKCQACHVSCALACTGAGRGSCVTCRKGYESRDGSCEDINECEGDDPCDPTTESCDNLPGSFMCRCRPDHEKVEGKCIAKKPKKKKKKAAKPRKPETAEGNDDPVETYSYFHVLGPLLIAAGVYTYVKPDFVVSLGLIAAVTLTIVLDYRT